MNFVKKMLHHTLVGGVIAGLVVLLFQSYFERTSKSLTGRVVSQVSLQPESTSALKGLQVSVDGVVLERPYLTTIEIKSDGSRPIPASDFESPIELRSQPGTNVVRVQVASVSPQDLEVKPTSDGQVVQVPPLLLNAGETFSLLILSTGDKPTFTPRVRIAGVQKMELENTPKSETKRVLGGVLLFIGLILLCIADLTMPSLLAREGVNMSVPIAAITSLTTGFVAVIFLAYFLESIGMTSQWKIYGTLLATWLAMGVLNATWKRARGTDVVIRLESR
ncbi:MAG: hypothetical protein Q8N13_15365 [Acidovorax sp.]|nr:hypothetical protein [Acidovorax sp.]